VDARSGSPLTFYISSEAILQRDARSSRAGETYLGPSATLLSFLSGVRCAWTRPLRTFSYSASDIMSLGSTLDLMLAEALGKPLLSSHAISGAGELAGDAAMSRQLNIEGGGGVRGMGCGDGLSSQEAHTERAGSCCSKAWLPPKVARHAVTACNSPAQSNEAVRSPLMDIQEALKCRTVRHKPKETPDIALTRICQCIRHPDVGKIGEGGHRHL